MATGAVNNQDSAVLARLHQSSRALGSIDLVFDSKEHKRRTVYANMLIAGFAVCTEEVRRALPD